MQQSVHSSTTTGKSVSANVLIKFEKIELKSTHTRAALLSYSKNEEPYYHYPCSIDIYTYCLYVCPFLFFPVSTLNWFYDELHNECLHYIFTLFLLLLLPYLLLLLLPLLPLLLLLWLNGHISWGGFLRQLKKINVRQAKIIRLAEISVRTESVLCEASRELRLMRFTRPFTETARENVTRLSGLSTCWHLLVQWTATHSLVLSYYRRNLFVWVPK